MIPCMQIARIRPTQIVFALITGVAAYAVADWLTGGLFPALSFIVGATAVWVMMRRDVLL